MSKQKKNEFALTAEQSKKVEDVFESLYGVAATDHTGPTLGLGFGKERRLALAVILAKPREVLMLWFTASNA